MRSITELIIHCTATPEGRNHTVRDIDRWHRARGWRCCGYHYVIYRDGSVHIGRPESQVGAHCAGHNAHSIGICYVGGTDPQGCPKDSRTPEQKHSLRILLHQLKTKYPNAKIKSHHTINPRKACPCFDADREYSQL